MSRLAISLACCDYARTRALFDGRVQVEGCEVIGTAIEPEEAFHRAFKYREFDVSELSLSSYTLQVSRGENPYVAVPAFVSRLFRHSGIYIRTDRGIKRPQDLKGKHLGLPEYQITANVWIRGMLKDEYGVDTREVHWRNGGVEEPGREDRKSTRLNSSHLVISYAVFCLKKKQYPAALSRSAILTAFRPSKNTTIYRTQGGM